MKIDKNKAFPLAIGAIFVLSYIVYNLPFVEEVREQREAEKAAVLEEYVEKLRSHAVATPNEYLPELQAKPRYDFREINWGMGVDEVKLVEHRLELLDEGAFESKKGYYYITFTDIYLFGYNWKLEYLFHNNRCFVGSYILTNASSSDFNIVVDRLSSVYGEPFGKREIVDKGSHSWWRLEKSEVIVNFRQAEAQSIIIIDFVSLEDAKYY